MTTEKNIMKIKPKKNVLTLILDNDMFVLSVNLYL
jgi:hypothetical protein